MGNPTTSPTPTVLERVRELVDEVLARTVHYVVDLEVRGAKGSQVVNVFIDSDESLGVGTLAGVSREVGFLLETEEVFDGRYRLTVSTPGVGRPLKFPRQYAKHVGRTLRVHHRRKDGEGHTESLGILSGTDNETIEVTVSDGHQYRIAYADIVWAKVQLPW